MGQSYSTCPVLLCLKINGSSGKFFFGGKTMENLKFILVCLAIFAGLVLLAVLRREW